MPPPDAAEGPSRDPSGQHTRTRFPVKGFKDKVTSGAEGTEAHTPRATVLPVGADRDFLVQILRGDITSEVGYEMIAAVRQLWRSGKLADDRELVAALHVGDNAHLDDARRWTTEPTL
jgi:hypothetical protein